MQRLAKKKACFPLVRNSLQSETYINHLAVTVVIWKSSVLHSFTFFWINHPISSPKRQEVESVLHKNIVCLIKKASVFVNENKTSVCFLFSKQYRVVFSTPLFMMFHVIVHLFNG